MKKIEGLVVDGCGRCIHYHSPVDVVANKCYFCQKYYSCFRCHDEMENHRFVPWPIGKEPDNKIVLCGVCQFEMTAKDYKNQSQCMNCGQLFNPNCSRHSHLYFSE